MLKVLRDNLKFLSWILWLVILVFIVFVFVDFGAGIGSARGATSAAATVGDRTISYKDFEREYRRLEDQYRQAFGERYTPQLADQLQLPAQALQRLVSRKLLASEARARGLVATDREVRQAILALPGLQDKSGHFVGDATYQGFLRANGFTAHEFESLMREDLVIAKLTGLVTSSVAVSDDETERAWRDQHETASIRYVFNADSRYAAKVDPTPDQVQAYFEAHRDDFSLPDQRVIDYLLVDASRLRAQMEVAPADVQSYYDAHQSDFSRPEQVHARHILIKVDASQDLATARKKMDEVQKRLAAGEDFAALAAKYSEDPGSKDKGGDLGYFGRGRMIKEFEQAAFDAQPGQVVGPVRTAFGLHLIQVLDHRQEGTEPLSEVEGRIRSILVGERAEAAASDRAHQIDAQLKAISSPDAAAFQKLADGDLVTFVTTSPFGKDDVVPGIGRNPDFTGAAFALAPGAVSEPVKVARGYAILRLRETRPAHVPGLDEVRARVRATVARDQEHRLAMADLESARARIAAGTPFDDAVKGLGLEAQDSGDFGRTGQIQGLGQARPVAEAAFALQPGELGGPVDLPAGGALFELVRKTPFDAAAYAKDKDAQRQQLQRDEADRLLSSILTERRKAVGVTYDPKLLEQFKIGTQKG
jgi:peptidyl-prolyl cis-trans isomerase D